jgi:hypothetical protein
MTQRPVPDDRSPPLSSSSASQLSLTSAARAECPTWDEIIIDVEFAEDAPDTRPTAPVAAVPIALAVGLEADTLEACTRSLGHPVIVVRTEDGAAAADLLRVLRPCVAMVGPAVSAADSERLRASASASGAHLVFVQPPLSPITVVPPQRCASDAPTLRMRAPRATFPLSREEKP